MSEPNSPTVLAVAARRLVAANKQAMLCTLRSEDGYPYGSLIDYMTLVDGDIITLLSRLAEHQKYISADPRASVFIAPALGQADALAEARVNLVGDMRLVENKRAFTQDYLSYHPQAQNYIEFADFEFYRLSIRHVRYIAGFGRMGWLDASLYASVPNGNFKEKG